MSGAPAGGLVARVRPSPLGPLRLVADARALVAVELGGSPGLTAADGAASGVLDLAAAELDAWFAGDGRGFTVPVAPAGTAFQRAVWAALVRVPYGETRSYAWLAAAVGRPEATRAVGAANGRNPLPIVVPCHRVVGADGRLVGFSGGLAAKAWLLDHEARHAGRPAPQLGLFVPPAALTRR